jgi:hypothetical protein
MAWMPPWKPPTDPFYWAPSWAKELNRKLNIIINKESALMSDVDDKLSALEAAQAANHAAIANELQQLATAIANQAPDLTPVVNRLITLTNAVQADTAALNADDPQPPTPVPPPDTPPDTPPASAKSSKK